MLHAKDGFSATFGITLGNANVARRCDHSIHAGNGCPQLGASMASDPATVSAPRPLSADRERRLGRACPADVEWTPNAVLRED